VNGNNAVLNLQETNVIHIIRTHALRSQLPATLAIGALALMSTGAQAVEPDEITISAPNVKTVGRDGTTGAPLRTSRKAPA
jgi:hypothetical protein